MTENGRPDFSTAGDLPELLWLIAEHEVDTIDALPISPLLQEALHDGLVHWPSSEEGLFYLTLTSQGRPLASSAADGAEWLRGMGRRALWRF